MRRHARIAATLVLGVVAVFAPLRDHEFVDYDDPVWITQLAHGLSREGLQHACCDEIIGNWIPTTALSMLGERELHGGSAPGFLIGNVVLHATSTLLLYAVLATATGAVWPSAFVAAVFGWHPLHVESVAWISQRKDVLCGLFCVLALGAPHARGARGRRAGRRAATLAAVALALASKPTAVTLPFVLVLFEWWPLRSLERSRAHGPADRCARSRASLRDEVADAGARGRRQRRHVSRAGGERRGRRARRAAASRCARPTRSTRCAPTSLDAVWPQRPRAPSIRIRRGLAAPAATRRSPRSRCWRSALALVLRARDARRPRSSAGSGSSARWCRCSGSCRWGCRRAPTATPTCR